MQVGKLAIFLFVAKQKNVNILQGILRRRTLNWVGLIQVIEDPGSGSQDYYAFVVGAAESSGDGKVNLNVGGVMLSGVLIDSGASSL